MVSIDFKKPFDRPCNNFVQVCEDGSTRPWYSTSSWDHWRFWRLQVRLTRYLPFAHDTTICRRVVKSKIGSLIREGPDKRPSAYTPIGPLRRQQSGLIGRHCHLHESYPAVLNIFQTSPLLYLPITLDLFQDQVQALARIAARPPSLNPSGEQLATFDRWHLPLLFGRLS